MQHMSGTVVRGGGAPPQQLTVDHLLNLLIDGHARSKQSHCCL